MDLGKNTNEYSDNDNASDDVVFFMDSSISFLRFIGLIILDEYALFVCIPNMYLEM